MLAVGWTAGASASLSDGIFAVVCGHLHDAPELARELRLASASTDDVLAAAAYRRWGEAAPAHLRGSWSLLVWEPAARRGIIAVDQLGSSGLFYAGSTKPAFANELRDLLALLPVTPEPDEEMVVRRLALGSSETGRTLSRGVERLPGGHLLRLHDASATRIRYWSPTYRPAGDSSGDQVATELRGALERSLARHLGESAGNGVLLSGGLDSAAVAGIARELDHELGAYSAVFPAQPRADEGEEIVQRAELLGMRSVRLAFTGGGGLAATLRHLDTWRTPPASPTLFFHEPLLELARAEGIDVMLDGQGGDELFAPSPYLTADRLRRGRLASTVALTRTLLTPRAAASRRAVLQLGLEYAVRGALPGAVHRAGRRLSRRPPPSWLTAAAAAQWRDVDPWAWKRRDGPRWWTFLVDATTEARERGGVGDFLRRLAADAGLRGAHPFLHDAELVETVLSLPPETAFDPVLDRAALRRALAGVLPDAVRLRTEKVYFDDVFAASLAADLPALHVLLGADAKILRYVHESVVERLLAGGASLRPRESWMLWRFAAVEAWLQLQENPGFVVEALDRLPLVEAELRLVA